MNKWKQIPSSFGCSRGIFLSSYNTGQKRTQIVALLPTGKCNTGLQEECENRVILVHHAVVIPSKLYESCQNKIWFSVKSQNLLNYTSSWDHKDGTTTRTVLYLRLHPPRHGVPSEDISCTKRLFCRLFYTSCRDH